MTLMLEGGPRGGLTITGARESDEIIVPSRKDVGTHELDVAVLPAGSLISVYRRDPKRPLIFVFVEERKTR
jgi:hypothetical protein